MINNGISYRWYSFLLALFLIPMLTVAQNKEEEIRVVLNDFLEGGTNGEVSRFQNAFLPDAVQKAVGKGGVPTGMSVQSLASKIKPGQVMDRTTKIISITIANDAAVGITETEYANSKVVDILNLVETSNGWKIASRVYSRLEKDQEVAFSGGNVEIKTNNKSATVSPVSKKAPAKTKAVAVDDW